MVHKPPSSCLSSVSRGFSFPLLSSPPLEFIVKATPFCGEGRDKQASASSVNMAHHLSGLLSLPPSPRARVLGTLPLRISGYPQKVNFPV